jgi:hypothetical protein
MVYESATNLAVFSKPAFQTINAPPRGWDNVVSTGRTVWGSNPSEAKIFYPGAHPSFNKMGTRSLFWE